MEWEVAELKKKKNSMDDLADWQINLLMASKCIEGIEDLEPKKVKK